jgi:predicted HicB family RNase H-like nuclease
LTGKWNYSMAEKTVNRRPRNVEVAQVINRGGSSPSVPDGEKERIFNLRVPNNLVEKVDALRKARTGKISRNTWILEAIEDKIEKELS